MDKAEEQKILPILYFLKVPNIHLSCIYCGIKYLYSVIKLMKHSDCWFRLVTECLEYFTTCLKVLGQLIASDWKTNKPANVSFGQLLFYLTMLNHVELSELSDHVSWFLYRKTNLALQITAMATLQWSTYSNPMDAPSHIPYNQTDEAFFFSCVGEVMKVWRSKSGHAILNISVENGLVYHQLGCRLGQAENHHMPSQTNYNQTPPRYKSSSCKAKDRARAAAHQQAQLLRLGSEPDVFHTTATPPTISST